MWSLLYNAVLEKFANCKNSVILSEPVGTTPLKDAQKTRLFSGGENHDFLLSEDVFSGVFCQWFEYFLAAN